MKPLTPYYSILTIFLQTEYSSYQLHQKSILSDPLLSELCSFLILIQFQDLKFFSPKYSKSIIFPHSEHSITPIIIVLPSGLDFINYRSIADYHNYYLKDLAVPKVVVFQIKIALTGPLTEL